MLGTLGDLLVEERLLDEASLRLARRHARRTGVALVRVLVEERWVGEAVVADLLARRLGLPRVQLAGEPVEDDAVREVPLDLADARRLLPLSIDRAARPRATLRVAMADPLDVDAVDELELSTGCDVVPLIATVGDVAQAIRRAYRGVVTKMIPREERLAEPAPEAEPAELPRDPTEASRTQRVMKVDVRTQPTHQIADEADADARLEALVDLLVERGVIDREAFGAAIRRVLRRRAGD